MKGWQNLFSSIVLKRGYDCYLEGSVDDIEETEDGFEAIVHGSREYTVAIGFDGDGIAYMECTCPYAKDGSSCKHEAAMLYELSADGRLVRIHSGKPSYDEYGDDAESIISMLDSKELKSFLISEIRCNPEAREHLLAAFADGLPKEYAASLQNDADSYIGLINEFDEEDYYDDWDDSDPRADWREALHEIAGQIKPFISGRQRYGNAFRLILHIIGSLADYDDDYVACEYAEMLTQAYSAADDEERPGFADMARKTLEDTSCNAGLIRDFLIDTVHDRDASMTLLLQAESALDDCHSADAEYDKARAMVALGSPDDDIDRFLGTCTGWQAVRIYAERLRKRKEWKHAAEAIGRVIDNLEADDREMASGLLLDIWRDAGDKGEYDAALLGSILRNRQRDMDRIHELKQRLSEDEWKKAYAGIIGSDTIGFIRGDVFLEEEDWPGLLAYIRKAPEYNHEDKYINALYRIYPGEVMAILGNDAACHGRYMNDRSSYRRYASSLRRLASYPEGSSAARMMARAAMQENPRRSALRDELRKAGFDV